MFSPPVSFLYPQPVRFVTGEHVKWLSGYFCFREERQKISYKLDSGWLKLCTLLWRMWSSLLSVSGEFALPTLPSTRFLWQSNLWGVFVLFSAILVICFYMETWGEMSSTISYCYYLFVSFFSNFNDLFVVVNTSPLTKRMLTVTQFHFSNT